MSTTQVSTSRRCPRCGAGARTTRPSRRRGIYEHTLSRLGWYPFRCHECRTRFFLRVEKGPTPVWRALQWTCVAGVFVMVAMVALVLALIIAAGDGDNDQARTIRITPPDSFQ